MSHEKPNLNNFESQQQPAEDNTYDLAWDPDDDTEDKGNGDQDESTMKDDDDTYALKTDPEDESAASKTPSAGSGKANLYTPPEPPRQTQDTTPRAEKRRATEGPASKEENEKIERLLEDIGKRGRMAGTVGVTAKLARERTGNAGFQFLTDKKDMSRALERLRPRRSPKTYPQMPPPQVLEKYNINAVTMLQPLTETEPRYEKREQVTRKGGIFRKEKRELRDTKVDEIEKPIPMSKYNNDETDNADAYCLSYYLTGGDQRNFLDPTTKRAGNNIHANLVLPKEDAEKVYEQLRQNPDLVRRVFRSIDPDFMDSMEEYMPDHRNVLVVPEGKISEEILNEENARNRTEATIDEQYIVSGGKAPDSNT